MAMGPQIFQVDAFTDKPFSGNPAAVCILSNSRDDEWMQRVAQEMNLSETAFLHKQSDGFSLRWFTPTMEVSLCGHATLASAHVLWESGLLMPSEQAQFYTHSGLLTVSRNENGIEMDFPAVPEEPAEAPPGGRFGKAGVHRGRRRLARPGGGRPGEPPAAMGPGRRSPHRAAADGLVALLRRRHGGQRCRPGRRTDSRRR